jgi:aquaporin Z
MNIKRRALAEGIGTFWLVFAGTGTAVITATYAQEFGALGVAFAFGLSLLTMAYAIGGISGCHINPAVTFGLFVAKRFPGREVAPYVASQVVGAIAASVLLMFIATGSPDYDIGHIGLGENGYGLLSPGGYSMVACFVTEFVLTAAFLFFILAATDKPAASKFAPVAIGMALTLIHLISLPVTNTSVNPARSTGPALLMGGPALSQLWLFWAAPLLGAAAGSQLFRFLVSEEKAADVAPTAGMEPARSGMEPAE